LETEEERKAIRGLGTENDEQARKMLIEHNLRLVVYIAKKFDNTGVGVEDLISIGTIGLIKAINTFDPDKNIKLATYASRCIENEILMYLRRNSKTKMEVSIDEPLNVDWDGNELLLSDILGTEEDAVYKDLENDAEKKVLKTSFTRKDIHFVSRTGVEIEYLLDHIRIGRAPVLQERQEILAYAASLFSDTPEMESHFYEILKKRDQIADTYMKPFHALLLHGKSPDIMHPCFGYVHLEPPIYENARIILGAIVTFIPENDPDQVSAPIVSEIIGSLMEQPELLKALREDDDEHFTLLLETSLMKFYKETAADRLKLSAQDK